MKFSDNAMSAILLCSYIGIQDSKELKPLSLGEWNALQDSLSASGKEPGTLLGCELEILKDKGFEDKYIERIQRLITRGNAVFALDELLNKGIGVITQFDAEYPKFLRKKLKKKMPPVLFYAGNIQLANKVGIAVVGSRNVDMDGINFTRQLVKKASNEKLVIYSGGAKGVDSISEQTAIQSGGAAVSFLADSLLTRIKKRDVLEGIEHGQLLLFSDAKPELGFTAVRAMNRNKYIYASSYGAFVVSSGYKTGGTWTGATEAMRNGWTKVLVWNNREYDGNQKLLEKGGTAYELSDDKLYDILRKKEQNFHQIDLFSMVQTSAIDKERQVQGIDEVGKGQEEIRGDERNKVEKLLASESYGEKNAQTVDKNDVTRNMYDCVKPYIIEHFDQEMNLDAASSYFQVAKGQMRTWLKRLCEEGCFSCKNGVYSLQNRR